MALKIACQASVSMQFWSIEQGTRVKERVKNGASKERRGGLSASVSFLPSPPSPPSFIFLLSFHFSRGQNRKSHSSVFLCSETTRKLKKMNSRCTLSRLFHLVHFNNNIACKTVSKPEVQEKKKKVVVLSMCPRSPQNMKFGSFTSYVL